jgi:hypothetical protein
MIAINKNNGDVFEVLNVYEFTFRGKCVKSKSKNFKTNEICKHLEKKEFCLNLDWKDIENLQYLINHTFFNREKIPKK